MKSNETINCNCWIAYFDILGFKELLFEFKDHLDIFVEEYYGDILKEVDERVSCWTDYVGAAWAFDSFLFFTFDDSLQSFTCINQVAQHFLIGLIWKKFPSRGALTVGKLYADHNSHIYIGPGLIDAYEYSEKQNWIGFVLAPSVSERLKITDLSGYLDHESDYMKYDVPVKEKEYVNGVIKSKLVFERLYAYKFTNYPYTEEHINEMFQVAKNKFRKEREFVYKGKYENTLKFIESLKLKSDGKY
ncbi:MAG: hypothetical protein WAV28_16880 [Sedimentisphaerales bacterium]|jgi:hypothetical protein